MSGKFLGKMVYLLTNCGYVISSAWIEKNQETGEYDYSILNEKYKKSLYTIMCCDRYKGDKQIPWWSEAPCYKLLRGEYVHLSAMPK